MVKWLVEWNECDSELEAQVIGSTLLLFGIIHHCVDDHLFKNEPMFYRFRADDVPSTYKGGDPEFQEAATLAVHAYGSMHVNDGLVDDRDYGLFSYSSCFVGSDFCNHLIRQSVAKDTADAVRIGKLIQKHGFIDHVTKAQGWFADHNVSEFAGFSSTDICIFFTEFSNEYLFFRFWADELKADSNFTNFLRSLQGLQYMGFLSNGTLGSQAIELNSSESKGPKLYFADDSKSGVSETEILLDGVAELSLGAEFKVESASTKSPVVIPKDIDVDAITRSLSVAATTHFLDIGTQAWFHGEISRDEAVKRLGSENSSNGAWLVRKSTTRRDNQLVVSLVLRRQVLHFFITQRFWANSKLNGGKPGTTYTISSGPAFATVPELLEHYKQDSPELPVALCSPVTNSMTEKV